MKEYNKVNKVSQEITKSEDDKKLEPRESKIIAQAKPIRKNLFSRLGNAIFGPDGLKGVGRYVGQEIVAPAVKGIIVDSVVASINTVIYGSEAPRTTTRSTPRSYGSGYTNYSRSYMGSPMTRTGTQYNRTIKAANRVQEYALEDRQQAADVLTALEEIADKYSVVTVADYYDAIGVATEYTDNNYGWELRDIQATRMHTTPDGFVLALPRPRSLAWYLELYLTPYYWG